MTRLFTREDIDFDKLHGEIRSNLARQRELSSNRVKSFHNWGCFMGKRAAWEKSKDSQHVVSNPSYELTYLRTRSTLLCSILNYAKGKHHFTKLTKSSHKYMGGPTHHDLMTLDAIHSQIFCDEWKDFIKEPQDVEQAISS